MIYFCFEEIKQELLIQQFFYLFALTNPKYLHLLSSMKLKLTIPNSIQFYHYHLTSDYTHSEEYWLFLAVMTVLYWQEQQYYFKVKIYVLGLLLGLSLFMEEILFIHFLILIASLLYIILMLSIINLLLMSPFINSCLALSNNLFSHFQLSQLVLILYCYN